MSVFLSAISYVVPLVAQKFGCVFWPAHVPITWRGGEQACLLGYAAPGFACAGRVESLALSVPNSPVLGLSLYTAVPKKRPKIDSKKHTNFGSHFLRKMMPNRIPNGYPKS